MTAIPPYTQFSLNIRGLVDNKSREPKLRWIKWLIQTYKPDMVHFQESHFYNMSALMSAMRRFGGKVVGVSLAPCKGSYCGVFTLIPPESVLLNLVEEHSVSKDGRYAMIKIKSDHQVLHILNIYAPASGKQAREVFFGDLNQSPIMQESSIIAVGDWNFTTDRLDRINNHGYVDPEPHPIASGFLDSFELIDIFRYRDEESVEMTHSVPSEGRWARLDRWYAQPDLLDDTMVLPTLSAAGVSDHDVIRLQYGNPYRNDKPTHQIYRMSVSLIKQLGINTSKVRKTTISLLNKYECLIDREHDPVKVLRLYDKCKSEIKEFYQRSDDKYGKARKLLLKQAIKLAEFDINPNAPSISEQLTRKEEAKKIIKEHQRRIIENIQLKSAFNWTRDGEHSNKLFFKATKQRIACSGIPNIQYKNFTSTSSFTKKLFIGMSFTETFNKRTPIQQDLTEVIDAVKATQSEGRRKFTEITKQHIDHFMNLHERNKDTEEPEEDWLIQAISGLKMYKAAGADGIPNEFYYLLRQEPTLIKILKKTFEKALELGTLPNSMRETYYKLLFKKGTFTAHEVESGALHGKSNDPRMLTNWRPIALLPCDSKILSSYIANNLKVYMDEVITRAQSAFVPGRSIQDNIMLIMQVIHHHMHTKEGAGIIFLDFAHAYDYISQDYIMAVLAALNFPNSILNAISMMMKDQYGRVIVNNDLTHKFPVNNGGKQGDPLFPLIYIAAMEGLYALLDNNPGIKGIKVPCPEKDIRFKHLGYADDTAIAIGNKREKQALERIFKTFENASGNEIKAAKSFVLWLGRWRNTRELIYNIGPMREGDYERYLGIQIGHHIPKIDQWSPTIDKLKNIFKYWKQFNLSIFGRTLLINSRMLSQIWYKASLVPTTPAQEKALETHVNEFFRKGKRNNTVSAATRVLPLRDGGLGQIHVPTQLHLLRIKWIIKADSGDAPLWSFYWAENIRLIKAHLQTETDLRVLSCNWNKVRATEKNGIFPFTLAAYKSWHALNFRLNVDQFDTAMCQPLIDNKYITDQTTNQPLRGTTEIKNLVSHLKSIQIGQFFQESEQEQDIPYDSQNPDSWRLTPKSPEEMNEYTGLQFEEQIWAELFDLIPARILMTITAGPPPPREGWAATELISLNEDDTTSIGDIYYIIPSNKQREMSLIYFEVYDNQLRFSEKSNPSWGDWQQEILPNLRSLAISCTSGLPRILGWSDQNLNLNMFKPPQHEGHNTSTIESMVASTQYSVLNHGKPTPTKRIKPTFNILNKKIRYSNSKPLQALMYWKPSKGEHQAHKDKVELKKIPPGTPLKINWQHRMQKIINCPFVKPKYRQLIYWITTGTLCTGKQLRHFSPRGMCPHCTHIPTTATWQHMFFECPQSQTVWEEIDNLGSLQWDNYIPLEYNEIPVILNEYSPPKLLQLSTLWALWVHWCKYFHDPENFTREDRWEWINIILVNSRDQFQMRLHEAHSAIQWLQIVSERRIHSKDKHPDAPPSAKAPEKEFLLIHSQSINTNADNIKINANTPLEFLAWIGNQYLIKLDSRDGANPRVKFNFHPWDAYTRPPDHVYPSDYGAGDWIIIPRHCLNDY